MKLQYKNNTQINLEIPSEVSKFLTDELQNYIVIKNGHIIKRNLNHEYDNVYINDYNFAITEKAEMFKMYHSQCVNENESITYNLENSNSGILIHVPKNLAFKDTLKVFYLSDQDEVVSGTTIVVEENSEFKYFEYIVNLGPAKINIFAKCIIKDNARLVYSGISKINKESSIVINRVAGVKRYGNILFSIAELNDANTISNTFIKLNDEYAVGTTKTVAITSKKQTAKFTQLVSHNAKFTEGYIENYGVSNDESKLVFEGIGKINKGMKQSIARQSNKGIVLGATSRLDANPLLLIDEYDVVASHGAAIGKIDDEQLYYLMSRGLTFKNAERLIINGFLSPVLKLLSSDELINDFVSSVANKTA
ncbi:MAG: SufD family Fe-S cluster assembly protein [Candidatus Izemoplasma sp.]